MSSYSSAAEATATAASRRRPGWRRTGRRRSGWPLLMPPLAMFLVFFIGPILLLLIVSFLEPSQTELYGDRATFENYARVLGDDFYLRIVQRTLLAGAVILGFSLLLGY